MTQYLVPPVVLTAESVGKTRISSKIRQPCGCIFQWYLGGKGYIQQVGRACKIHRQNQKIFICTSNPCGKAYSTEWELKACKWSHAK